MERVKIDKDQTIYPYAIRNHMHTASTTISDGVLSDKSCLNRETRLTDADPDAFADVLMVYGANSSDQAIRINFHENFGGASAFKLQMAASTSNSLLFQVPWKATEKGTAWWVDYDVYGGVTDADDVTNTVVNVSMQYIKSY